jgi:NAD(P)-dependent dehydrogenase (short-subunit alcohol dehydrogenase family)
MSKDSKYVVVTGAAGGIGQAIVAEFASNGYTVIATDCVSAPTNLGAHHYVQADLTKTVEDEAYAQSIFDQINSWLGSHALNVLVNNAAVQILGGVDSLTRKDWQITLNVNLMAPFVWTQALLPKLEQEQGSVVNISSIHAKLTKKNFVAYATSKAALSGMTRALAQDVESRIRINAIEPAAIDTPMLRAGLNNDTALYALIEGYHPQKRIGHPKDVAGLVYSIASDQFQFMHGTCVGIDGGILSSLHDPT